MNPDPNPRPQRVDPPFTFSKNGLEAGSAILKPTTSIRTSERNLLPWVKATGSAWTLERKAAHYLRIFNHNKPFRREMPELTLVKVVCNLRNYYQQDLESTIRLVRSLYSVKCGFAWTPEGIRLAWDGSESMTPSLGLADRRAIAKQRAAFLENEVVDLIAWTKPGGRVLHKELLSIFRDWNPEIEVTSNLFSRAVTAVTGIQKTPSNGAYFWVGFRLPTDEECEGRVVAAA